MDKVNVLIVDQSLAFGRSLASAVSLFRGIDRRRFRLVFVSAADESTARDSLAEVTTNTRLIFSRRTLHDDNLQELLPRLRRSRFAVLRSMRAIALYTARMLANLSYMVRIARIIRELDVQIVQLNDGITDEVALVCRLLKVRQVVYVRTRASFTPLQRHLLVPFVSQFLTESHFLRDKIVHHIEPGRVMVATPPAVRQKLPARGIERLRRHYRLSGTDTVIGIFGPISQCNGQLQYLRAAATVLQHQSNVMFVLVGAINEDTPYFRSLEDFIATAGMQDRTLFTGKVDAAQDFYQLVDLVVQCSSEAEPCCPAIVEAMSHGKPVIASCLGSPGEFIDHGVDGYLVDAHNPDALAARMLELIQDPGTAKQVGAVAQIKMEHLYNKAAYAQRLESCYERCIIGNVPHIPVES